MARVTAEQKKEIVARIAAGETYRSIADAVGMKVDAVSSLSRRMPETRDLPLRSPGRPREVDGEGEARVCALIREGKSAADIRDSEGLGRTMIERIAKRNGLRDRLTENFAARVAANRSRDHLICERILQGASRETTAREFGLSVSAIGSIWAASPQRARVNADMEAAVTWMLREGSTMRNVAQALGKEKKTISNIWNRHSGEPWWFEIRPGRRPARK